MNEMRYPPPKLIRRKSRAPSVRRTVFVITLGLLVGTCTLARLTHGSESDKAGQGPLSDPPTFSPSGEPSSLSIGPAETPPPVESAKAGAPSVDARLPDHWYYVPQIGDGPGAIYSRNGGGWDYAFACTLPTRTIEFIAVNTGDPGAFDQQYMRVGRVKLMLDASYSKEGHGTISTRLAARHPFFDAFVGTDKAIELQLLADHKIVIPVGTEVTRLIRDCRGADEPPKTTADRKNR